MAKGLGLDQFQGFKNHQLEFFCIDFPVIGAEEPLALASFSPKVFRMIKSRIFRITAFLQLKHLVFLGVLWFTLLGNCPRDVYWQHT